MSEYILSVKGLYKKYGKIEVLKNLTLDIKRGEVVGILGLDGAGKTTALKLTAGILRPTLGEIFIDGYEISAQPVRAKARLGYLPDEPFLYDKLTGREFVRFMAGLYTTRLPENIGSRIEEFFYLFDIEEKIDERIQNYSPCVRQKIGLISAMIHNPGLLVCDKPTSELNFQSIKVLKEIFNGYRRSGKGVFMATSIVEHAESFCDRVAIIHEGALLAFGAPDSLLRLSRRAQSLNDVFVELTGGQAIRRKEEQIKKLLSEISDGEGAGE